MDQFRLRGGNGDVIAGRFLRVLLSVSDVAAGRDGVAKPIGVLIRQGFPQFLTIPLKMNPSRPVRIVGNATIVIEP